MPKFQSAKKESEEPFGLPAKTLEILKADHSGKFFSFHIGLALVITFLALVSLVPQIDQKLGDIASKKRQQQSLAAPASPSPTVPAQPEENRLTEQFLAQWAKFEKATGGEKENIKKSLAVIAQKRKELLLALIEGNPQKIIDLKIPKNVREALPTEVAQYIEQDISITGTLDIIHTDDFEHSISKTLYFLISGDKRYSLYTKDELPRVLSASRVRVSGVALDDKIAFNMKETLEIIEAAAAATSGEQKIIALLVNFQDTQKTWGDTTADYEKILFTNTDSVNAYYQEVSYQKTNLAGEVKGWYTMDLNESQKGCDFGAIQNAAIAKADPDVDFKNYKRLILFLGKDFTQYPCPFGGLGSLGLRNITTADGLIQMSIAWIFYQSAHIDPDNNIILNLSPFTPIHELGHNLGIHHANGWECGAVSVDYRNSCTSYEYGDRFDVMGTVMGHFNALHKEMLAWFDPSNVIDVDIATKSGQFTIEPLEPATSGPKYIRLHRSSIKPVSYLEYRRRLGFDSNLLPEVENGVLIHHDVWSSDYHTQLIDATPNSTAIDFRDAYLAVGKTFVEPMLAFSITTVSAGGHGLTVDIQPYQSPDSDGDGLSDAVEFYVGTDPFDNCADNSLDNAWPPDFDNNRTVDITDIGRVAAAYGKTATGSNRRLDLYPDGFIDITDKGAVANYFGRTCTP